MGLRFDAGLCPVPHNISMSQFACIEVQLHISLSNLKYSRSIADLLTVPGFHFFHSPFLIIQAQLHAKVQQWTTSRRKFMMKLST